MATAKSKTKVSEVKEEILSTEKVVEIKIESGKTYKFISNGKFVSMPKDKEYILTAELAELFTKKGFGKCL